MAARPWGHAAVDLERFRRPPREYGILPFWFLNGELDPDEMRRQIGEFRDKGMPGIVLHGRYGLETPYIGDTYLDRIRLAVEECDRVGLHTWIYDEMNWPSGTADGRVLRERPELAQRYVECIALDVRGPWFAYLTGADSRYLDFERSTPLAAFAVSPAGEVVDLTPNLSFHDVIPWEVPPGNWKLLYLVEKRADYYIDALDPEATEAFLRIGYDPYAASLDGNMGGRMVGFYTDEPAMHYYLTGQSNPIVPWTRDMFRRFRERNGYSLRPRLPDLFLDVGPDSARLRYDFYRTLTDFYSEAFYRQIHEWCAARGVLFTGHLLYEEFLRNMIRVEGNLFRHYPHFDVVGVDHLYPIIGTRDAPAEHVAMKVASSAAHQLGSERLLCESFGGLFIDATMQRMKWVTDWEYVLGVNLLNPHGFHYTLEGPRKRDWPPSMFYQYPWWGDYGRFSEYVSRLSSMLTGGRHVAKLAVLWPINAMFATYLPQGATAVAARMERDFNTLTDLLLRLHHDFDYVDEDDLAAAELDGGTVRLGQETHELVVLPPMTHLRLETLEVLERLVAQGGRVLGAVVLPDQAFGPDGLVDVADRVAALFGVDPRALRHDRTSTPGLEVLDQTHDGGGRTAFVRSYALARALPGRLQAAVGAPGVPESDRFVVEPDGRGTRYVYESPDGVREDVTAEVAEERAAVEAALADALARLVEPDVVISNPEVFALHRVKDDRDLVFVVNPTFSEQTCTVGLDGAWQPLLWDPSTGEERPIAPWTVEDGRTRFELTLPPVGSVFVMPVPEGDARVLETNVVVDDLRDGRLRGRAAGGEAYAVVEQGGARRRIAADGGELPAPVTLDGEWELVLDGPNALVVDRWHARELGPGDDPATVLGEDPSGEGWIPMRPGAWAYQLPVEPERPFPLDVLFRIPVRAEHVPDDVELLVDGYAGSDWQVLVNGRPVEAAPHRSRFDAQIGALPIAELLVPGHNVIGVRLRVTAATDGLLDLLKLTGTFAVETDAAGRHRTSAPRTRVAPASLHDQGHPFFSGCARYRRRVRLPEAFAGRRVRLEPTVVDDVVEVTVNGRSAGVRLWPPYGLDVTSLLRPGENEIELRVANTAANLFGGTPRPSGLAGPPVLVPEVDVDLELPS